MDNEYASLFTWCSMIISFPIHSIIYSIVTAFTQYWNLDVEWLSDVPCRTLNVNISRCQVTHTTLDVRCSVKCFTAHCGAQRHEHFEFYVCDPEG